MLNTCKNSAFKIIKKNIFSIRMTWKSNKYIINSIDRDINRKEEQKAFAIVIFCPCLLAITMHAAVIFNPYAVLYS